MKASTHSRHSVNATFWGPKTLKDEFESEAGHCQVYVKNHHSATVLSVHWRGVVVIYCCVTNDQVVV